jgi:hypothetical protein
MEPLEGVVEIAQSSVYQCYVDSWHIGVSRKLRQMGYVWSALALSLETAHS